MLSLSFQFFAPFAELVKKGINPEVEDVFYNYTNVTSMTKSQTKWAFGVVKKFHVITLQAFIDVCSPPYFVVVDLNCRMGFWGGERVPCDHTTSSYRFLFTTIFCNCGH
jgi:hypothetical protein